MTVSPSSAIYQFLKAAQNEASLTGTEVQPTVYSAIREAKTIRVGNAKFALAPVGEVTKSFDVEITLQILAKVEDAEDAETYAPALDTVWAMTIETANLMNQDSSLGGKVCGLLIMEGFQGWANVEGGIYAVSLLPVRINPTGKYE